MGASPPVIHNMKKNLMYIWLQEKKKSVLLCNTAGREKNKKTKHIYIFSRVSVE